MGNQLVFHRKDGNTETYTCRNDDEHGSVNFYNDANGEALSETLEYTNSQWITHWTLGSENYLTLRYLGMESQLPVTIKERPTYPGQQDIALGETKEAIIGDNKTADFRFVPEEDGEYTFFSNADCLTIGYIYDEDGNELASNVYGGTGSNFAASYVMTAGTPYLLKCRYYFEDEVGVFDVSVKVADNYVGKLTLNEPKKLNTVTKAVYYRYAFTPTETDTYVFKTSGTHLYADVPQYLFDGGERLDGHSNRNGHEYLAHRLEAGKTYLLTVSCNPGDDTSVVAEKLDTSHIQSVTATGDATLYENINGYNRYSAALGREYFYYYTFYNLTANAGLTVTYTDGTAKTYGVDDLVDDHYSIRYTDNQSDEHPWTKGSEDNLLTLTTMGLSADLKVNIIDNPVTSISFTPAQPIVLTENTGGYWNDDYTGKQYYHYLDTYSLIFSAGNRLTLHYNDNTSKTYTYNQEQHTFVAADGKALNTDLQVNDTQYRNHWLPTASNVLTVSCFNQSVDVPVTIGDGSTQPVHQHDYQATKTVKPTCTAKGYTVYTCSCGDSYNGNEVPALGHGWSDWKQTKAPTCTVEGEETRFCRRCQIPQTRKIAATGHTPVTDKAVATTCGKAGLTAGSHCSVCQKVLTAQKTVPATGKHQYKVDKITKATATKKGKITYKCKVCGKTYSETIAKNAFTAKGKKVTVKAATLKKKSVTLARKKVITYSKAKGTVTYKKASGNKKITVNAKTGKITVKKGLKKGTYKVKIKVTAKGNSKYKAATKTVTVTIVVK